jgi:hypothetical protein
LVSGRTAQTGVFAFSVTATDGTRSFVTDYRLRVLHSGAPPHPGGCLSNPVVANTAESGEGTLRQAVMDACAGGTITFGAAVRGTISLTSGPIEISKNLTIAGPGADALTIRNGAGAGYQNHVIYVNAGNAPVVLSGLTISDGYADGGGGILNGGNLTVRNAVITNNHTDGLGAGILSGGTLTLVNSIVTGNGDPTEEVQGSPSQGGGIFFGGTLLTITDSTVSGNQANHGGGIYLDYGGSVSITNSTIRENVASSGAGGLGGGLYVADGMATLTNCTVSQNRSETNFTSNGGGIFVGGFGTLTLINSTITNNHLLLAQFDRTGGIANDNGTVNARNSIIAGNTSGDDVPTDFRGTLTSQGYNFIGTDFELTIVGDATGNIVGTNQAPIDARLGPLAYNGGPTMTHALLTGSPAINSGNTATSPNTDQRGFGRNGIADMGAFELNGVAGQVPVVGAVSRKTHSGAGTFDIDLPLTGPAGVECRSGGANGNHTVIVNFANPLTSVGTANVTTATGSVSASQIGSDRRQYVISLTGVSNAQRLTVTLNNVTDSLGYHSSTIPVTVGLLLGDSNSDGMVNSGDAQQTRNRSGQTTDATNFRSDYNLDGTVNSGDANIVRSRSGQSLP